MLLGKKRLAEYDKNCLTKVLFSNWKIHVTGKTCLTCCRFIASQIHKFIKTARRNRPRLLKGGAAMEASVKNGPLLDDKSFYQEHLNYSVPGLEKVKEAAEQENYEEAGKQLAAYIRESLTPEKFFTIPYEIPENVYTLPGESEKEAADRICTHNLISCGTPHQFGETVDWFVNPTYNQYKEWTWQLSRHNEWKLLAHVYRQTGDEKYARCCAQLFESWVKQAVRPGEVQGFETLCWRTIECGIRMGANWPYVLHTFYQTPAFTDQILVDWYKSVWEHGKRLHDHHMHGNWLIMEMNGLAQIGILYPVFQESEEWFEFAMKNLGEELSRQVYPDGFQYELSTGYHDVVINNYQRLISVAKTYGREIPESFLATLQKMARINILLRMPDGKVPDINDGCHKAAAELLEPKLALFPDNEEFRWAVSGGTEGRQPEFLSVVLPESGFMVMRNGWDGDAVWGFFDAAPFGRGHQHEDKLSFLIYAGGKYVLTEAGNYAYDDSEMRRYVLSTRSHNTVRVNGTDQNRRKNYAWNDEDIKKHSGIKYNISPDVDYAEGTYDEGYGENADTSAVHTRAVYFVKNVLEGSGPFFLAVDRLKAETEQNYEIVWHLDQETLTITKNGAEGENIVLLTSEENAGTAAVYGQAWPEWQGFVSTANIQGAYAPVYTVKHLLTAADKRVVTLLWPKEKEQECPVVKVSAPGELTCTEIVLELADGSKVRLDEKDLQNGKAV